MTARKKRRIGKQCFIRNMFQKHTGQNGRKNLCRHGKGVIISRISSHIRTFAHIHYHRIHVHRKGRKTNTAQSKYKINGSRIILKKKQQTIDQSQNHQSAQDGFFRPIFSAAMPTGIKETMATNVKTSKLPAKAPP